jgi:hypothetical protein
VTDDLGFAGGAKFVSDYFAAEYAASIVKSQASIADALKFIDQCVKSGVNDGSIVVAPISEFAGYRKGAVAQRAIERIGCCDMREDELLESVDAILQFLKMVLIERGHGGESPVVGEPALSTPPANAPHCLSETAE